MEPRLEELRVGNGGWCRWVSMGPVPELVLRFEHRDGELVITELYLCANLRVGAIVSDTGRKVPFGRIAMAAAAKRAEIVDRMSQAGLPLQVHASHYQTAEEDAPGWVGDALRAQRDVSTRVPAARGWMSYGFGTLTVTRPAPTLVVPTAKPYPDTFYADVAVAYRHFAQERRDPASAIADRAGVRASTAYRWVRVAREKGLLPLGSRGRVTF
jgi:hypothetical protein